MTSLLHCSPPATWKVGEKHMNSNARDDDIQNIILFSMYVSLYA